MFCKLKPHTEDARKAFQKLGYSALAYTSDSTNRDEVKQCFGQGHLAPDSGGKAFLCCTSGLGAGINLPNIDFVYFLGTPWDLFEVIQAGGRGEIGITIYGHSLSRRFQSWRPLRSQR